MWIYKIMVRTLSSSRSSGYANELIIYIFGLFDVLEATQCRESSNKDVYDLYSNKDKYLNCSLHKELKLWRKYFEACYDYSQMNL